MARADLPEGRGDGGRVEEVHPHRLEALPERARHLRQTRLGDVEAHDDEPVAAQLRGDGAAHAARGPGDDGDARAHGVSSRGPGAGVAWAALEPGRGGAVKVFARRLHRAQPPDPGAGMAGSGGPCARGGRVP